MRVKDLIKQLKKFPSNTTVVVNMGRSELANGGPVNKVESVNAIKNWRVFGDRYSPDDYFGLELEDEESRETIINITG